MAVFQKKTTIVHHITYMGIMSAINLIFILLATYLPFLMFIILLILPFVSTIVSYYCDKRYYIIYALASIGLCLIFNINDTIFYVVPAIITGFVIGLLLEKKANPFWLILISSLIEAALTFAFIPLINLIGNIDIVQTFLAIFKLDGFLYKNELTYLFIYLLALIQCSLTHFILLSDAKKIGIQINTGVASFAPYIIGEEVTIALSITFAFFYPPIAFTLLAVSIYFSFFLLIDIVLSKRIITYIVLGGTLLISFFAFAIIYSLIIRPFGLMYVILFPLAICITSFVNNYLLNRDSNI